jgi:hypothetical protein
MAPDRRKTPNRKPKPSQKVVLPSELRCMQNDAATQRPPFPTEGMARCTCNDGIEDDLQIGEVVYLREIPNMAGHCVILRDKKAPLVGYHLDRFELLAENET